jgi:hypothetical protein
MIGRKHAPQPRFPAPKADSQLDSARRYIAHVLSEIRRSEIHGRASARSGGNPLFSRDSLDRIWPKD